MPNTLILAKWQGYVKRNSLFKLEPPETPVLIRHYFIILNLKKKCQRPGYTHLPALARTQFTEVTQLCVFPHNDSSPVVTSEDDRGQGKGNPFIHLAIQALPVLPLWPGS